MPICCIGYFSMQHSLPQTPPQPSPSPFPNHFDGLVRMRFPVFLFNGCEYGLDVNALGFKQTYRIVLLVISIVFAAILHGRFQQLRQQLHHLLLFKADDTQEPLAFGYEMLYILHQAGLNRHPVSVFPPFSITQDHTVQVAAPLGKAAHTDEPLFQGRILLPFAGEVVPILSVGQDCLVLFKRKISIILIHRIIFYWFLTAKKKRACAKLLHRL